MRTPILDYLNEYSTSDIVRAHMPGHKGVDTPLGVEHLDLTEVEGADELYSPEGIIAESERNASEIFEAYTFYSTEGSSLSIRAMLLLTMKWAKRNGRTPHILAGRNAHKTFINGVAVLDMQVSWLYGKDTDSYEMCSITPEEVEEYLAGCTEKDRPVAVYITSPDYLGNIVDVKGIAEVAHRYGCLMLVDNAHGAYLKFCPGYEGSSSMHPIDLGADMTADSAHKTLPVLTGGAYLQISRAADPFFRDNAKEALAFFGTTSPSYLIMASLDQANGYMEDLGDILPKLASDLTFMKENLRMKGWTVTGDEFMKITIEPLEYGYTGLEVADILKDKGIMVEYRDESHVVMMLTCDNSDEDLARIQNVLGDIPRREPQEAAHPIKRGPRPEQVMSPREAMLSDTIELPVEQCIGRICAEAAVSCPPAVPVFMYGERIDRVVNPGSTMKVVRGLQDRSDQIWG